MKELSIEEKAKHYDEAIERAKEMIKSMTNVGGVAKVDDIQYLFPELKESEDERIRKGLIEYFLHYPDHEITYYGLKADFVISWLEKQGENNMGISEATKQELEDNLNKALEKETPESWNEFLEKQGDDKFEQKFKIGDWVVFNNKHQSIYQVEKIEDGYYILRHTHGGIFRVCVLHDESLRPWTIQDAKDGDVLATLDYILIFKEHLSKDGGVSYCHYNFGAGNPQFVWLEDKNWYFGKEAIIHPATKEQHDLLFQKMKEAGYEWDSEKKELIKIEQKQVIDYPDSLPKDNWELTHEFVEKFGRIPKDEDELNALVEYVLKRQKLAKWSEEDEKTLKEIITDVRFEGYNNDLQGNSYRKIRWLKSLKERYTWKPSEEQMVALSNINLTGSISYAGQGQELINLYNDLKKLK